jgi:UDP-2,4-diacetamido-2,4,6-trideoxy-beta-L-altropyranose hydrolase
LKADVISLRPVTLEDQDMIFRWRNDPFILSRGSANRAVSLEEHRLWFEETIRGLSRKMFIVLRQDHLRQDHPIGQVRFDRTKNQECVVSVYLLQEFTGHGWGVEAIRKGCAEVFRAWEVKRVIACVRVDNPVGRSAFLKAGFNEMQGDEDCPPDHHALVFARGTSEANF